MKCPKCGTEFQGNFCPQCGQFVDSKDKFQMNIDWSKSGMDRPQARPRVVRQRPPQPPQYQAPPVPPGAPIPPPSYQYPPQQYQQPQYGPYYQAPPQYRQAPPPNYQQQYRPPYYYQTPPQYQYRQNPPRKNRTTVIYTSFFSSFVGLLLLVMMVVFIFSGGSDEKDNREIANEAKPKAETSVAVNLEPYETELGAGNYIAGVDIPAGKYDLEAVSGGGNVNSDNIFTGGINEIMGVEDDDFYIKTYNNLTLEDGETLEISDTLVLKISSDGANVQGIKAREVRSGKEVELSSGLYIAGEDFEAGYYTIVCTGAMGNVSSSNMYEGGLNEIMGPGGDDFSIKEFKNAYFPSGTELEISGTSVKLVPVGT